MKLLISLLAFVAICSCNYELMVKKCKIVHKQSGYFISHGDNTFFLKAEFETVNLDSILRINTGFKISEGAGMDNIKRIGKKAIVEVEYGNKKDGYTFQKDSLFYGYGFIYFLEQKLTDKSSYLDYKIKYRDNLYSTKVYATFYGEVLKIVPFYIKSW